MTLTLSAASLAALKADLAIPDRWLVVSANVTQHEHTAPGDPTVPSAPTTTIEEHTTMTLVSEARGLNIVCMMEGPIGAPTVCRVHYKGTPFETADAALITQLVGLVPGIGALRDAELLADLTASLE